MPTKQKIHLCSIWAEKSPFCPQPLLLWLPGYSNSKEWGKIMLQEQQGNMRHWFNFFVVVYFTVYCQHEVEPGDRFKRTVCCVCLRNSNFVTQIIFLKKFIFNVSAMLLFVIGRHKQRGGACTVLTFRKPGIMVGPGKLFFISTWV